MKNARQRPMLRSDLVGAVPRVDLLPPEVHERKKTAAVRSGVILLALIAAAVVGGAYTFATVVAAQTSVALETEQQRTLDLLAQQQDFVIVRQVQSRVSASEAAERVGLSSEIDWYTRMVEFASALPAGVTIASAEATAATPLAPYEQPTVPLQGARVAGLQVTVASPSVIDVAALIETIPQRMQGVTSVVYLDSVEGDAGVLLSTFMIYFDQSVLVSAQVEEEAE